MKPTTCALAILLCVASHSVLSSGYAVAGERDKTWFANAGYGVFVHYLGGGPDWNDTVNSFNVERFADQIARTGAAYLIFTLGQNSGYYCSPNATYERYAGYKLGQRCSTPDLPMEIADALAKRGVRLMLYLPSRSPQRDAKAMAGLDDVHERQPAPQEFTRKWSDVIREWSLRYGTKVSGWWFDGSYNRAGWDDLSKPYNWNTWAAAVRAGNPNSLLAFNPGASIAHAFNKLTDQQDYTAGEQNEFGATPQSNPAQGGLQWHFLSYLGSQWGRADGPRKSDQWTIDYIRKVNEQGGVVTLDIHCSADGAIYEPHLAQLGALRKALRPRSYYVATNGSDDNPGTLNRPFATLEKARDAVRQFKTRGLSPEGVTVYLRGGRYFRTKSFVLTDADSGQEGKPIVYRAYPGEAVQLAAGRVLPAGAFALVSSGDAAWPRLPRGARGKCLKADLSSVDLELGEPLRNELSFNGTLMQLARWPNEGFVRTTSAERDITFGYDDPRPARWLHAPDAYAAGYWRHGWANRIERIASIDAEARKITLARAPGYGIQPKKPYYVLNLLEEIDQPAEWYLDRAARVLYLWPPEPLEQAEVMMSMLSEPVVELKGASHVRLEGLCIGMGADDGIAVSGGSDNVVADCVVRNVRGNGITLSGTRHGVTLCRIHGIGQTGVSVSGGDRYQLIAGENFVRDCQIHDFGRWQRTYAPAIRFSGVGNVAANNLLYDGPHSAILFGGNEHRIELNEIHSVCYEVDDAGSIYCGRDWGLRGNVIRHNFFHHITSHLPGSNGVHAVYLDDCASGITVFGNTFYEISGRAIMCGGGRDNTIANNVIVRCGSAHFTDRRGKAWIDKDTTSWNLLDKIKRYNYTQPPWSTRYPRLAHILDNGYEQAKEPEGCVIRLNIGWQNERWLEKNCLGACGGFDFYTFEHNIEDQDPRFVDEASLNLALRTDSPAYSLPGFERIPFDQIGPTGN